MAGMKDVARFANVGIGTVSRVVNGSGYVSDEVRDRVNKVIASLNYTPNHSAQSLKTQKTKMVGLFVPTINHPFFAAIAQQIESMLDKNGYKLMLICSQDKVEKENGIIKLVAQNRMDGAIFFTHQEHKDISPKYSIVALDRHLGENIPCIASDNYESTQKALDHLLSRGCKKIGYIGGKPGVESEVSERLRAYRDTVAGLGMGERIIYEPIAHGTEAVYAEKFLKLYGECDGVFVSGDVLAIKLYSAAIRSGRRVPEDLKIISFDGVMGNWMDTPVFTTVRQNLCKLSEAIVEQLINKIEKRDYLQRVIVPCDFIIGETT